MSMIPVHELHNHTNELIDRVRLGEDFTITADGVPIATLLPPYGSKRSSMPREEFIRVMRQSDAGLRDDLAAFDEDTPDDLGGPQVIRI